MRRPTPAGGYESPTMVLTLLVVLSMISSAHLLVVHTAQGQLRGEAHEGFISYNGIPYASVNEESAKFKRAGLAPTWSGIRESQTSGCSSYSKAEDCLQLDVHVSTDSGTPWPVLVWVTGGSGRYNPAKLVRQGVTVVIVHHRLGPLGFLCLRDTKCPGNAGAKDVVLALRWVRDNISAFRGNPHKVTVAGQGFGAAIVEALLLSPMAQHLFHGAILQSGSVICPWSFNYDAKYRGLVLSDMLAEDNSEASDVMQATAEKLAAQSYKLNLPYFAFGLCVENEHKNEERLLSEPPYRLLSRMKYSKVPLMIGYNSNEAYVFTSILKQSNVRRKISNHLSLILPDELKFGNDIELNQVMKQVKDLYFKNNTSMTALLDYHRDAYFVNHIFRSARLHASFQTPVYFYQFSHDGSPGVASFPGVKKNGAAHSDELAYLFPEYNMYKDMPGDDGVVQRNLILLWTNFVKYLDPTPRNGTPPHWRSLDPLEPYLMDIGAELAMKEFPHKAAARLWDDVFDRFYFSKNPSND